MNGLDTRWRGWLLWLLPLAALAAFLGWQTDWGRALRRVPVTDQAVVPAPVTVAVLPEYRASAAAPPTQDMVARTLFNPTRRPAPVAAAEVAKPRIQRGQFALTGTLVVDGKATAFLKESAGGKPRRVAQGETVNGMLVAEVKPDRVRFTMGDESEELALKVAAGPKTTIQPQVAPAPGSGGAMGAVNAAAGPAFGPGGAAAAPGTPGQPTDVTSLLNERRRVAREAEATRAAGASADNNVRPAGTSTSSPAVIPPPAGTPDAQWQSVYQRYQQPRR